MWNTSTSPTAMARRPWMSGRNGVLACIGFTAASAATPDRPGAGAQLHPELADAVEPAQHGHLGLDLLAFDHFGAGARQRVAVGQLADHLGAFADVQAHRREQLRAGPAAGIAGGDVIIEVEQDETLADLLPDRHRVPQ